MPRSDFFVLRRRGSFVGRPACCPKSFPTPTPRSSSGGIDASRGSRVVARRIKNISKTSRLPGSRPAASRASLRGNMPSPRRPPFERPALLTVHPWQDPFRAETAVRQLFVRLLPARGQARVRRPRQLVRFSLAEAYTNVWAPRASPKGEFRV